MSNPIVKICGLSTLETVKTSLKNGADWIGLVTFEPSPRHVSPKNGKDLADFARGRTKIVSLSVNADDAVLDDIMENIEPDIFQFHGTEPPERVSEIKARFGTETMKAIGVSTSADLAKIDPYVDVADYILLDAKPPKDATRPGGNGATFDWSILDDLPDDFKFMLSGGLTVENVGDAVRTVKPFAVDVSSGVESSPGVKDDDLIMRFIEAAKLLDQA